MKKWFLREHLGVCHVEDARAKGLLQLIRSLWGNCCQFPESSRKAWLLGSFWKCWNGLHVPSRKFRAWIPLGWGSGGGDDGDSGMAAAPARTADAPHPLVGASSMWEARALLALWEISFQPSGGWRADCTRPLCGFRHMETESKCWSLELRDKILIQKSGQGLWDRLLPGWLRMVTKARQSAEYWAEALDFSCVLESTIIFTSFFPLLLPMETPERNAKAQ